MKGEMPNISEEESRSKGRKTAKEEQASTCSAEVAKIEVARRPRGRPPGSKNKPKPLLFMTRDATECSMRPHILEVPGGIDIVDAIATFAHRRNIGLSILSATGSVSDVTLLQPSAAAAGSTVTFHGRFDIISISATFFPPSSSAAAAAYAAAGSNGFSISIAGAQGQIFGGFVAGPLVAVGTVVVIAAAFESPSFNRLPLEEEISATGVCSSVTGVDSNGSSYELYSSNAAAAAAAAAQHVIWAPTPSRQSFPPPPY